MYTKVSLYAEIIVKGHILNAPWKSRIARRRQRGMVTARAVSRYLDRYVEEAVEASVADCGKVLVEAVQASQAGCSAPSAEAEHIFSIWFSGEETAPAIVKACWRSIREHSSLPLVVLDENSLWNWISLPQGIIEKWKDGKIRPAHFADICRIELLYRHGGFWLDATDFITAELPAEIASQPFFVYMAGENIRGFYGYIQNCFIRGQKGNYLLKCWREAVLAYWSNEDSAVDYFVNQLLFKKVIEVNPQAAALFAKMPQVPQDATHELWYNYADKPFDQDLFRDITAKAAFQKTDYKSSAATSPIPGSFAEAIIKGV